MASKARELLKRVLKDFDSVYSADLIDEIEALLAQPEHIEDKLAMVEPVAWMSTNGQGGISIDSYYANHKDYIPLYAAPPTREPLSDDEIEGGRSSAFHIWLKS